MPGRTVARPDSSGTPEATVPAGIATGRPPATEAASPPGERTSRFSRIEHARAASIAVQVPEAMLPSQIAYHAAFLDHEYAVAASYAQARASEPGLTCNEWTRRNPFVPAGPMAARDG